MSAVVRSDAPLDCLLRRARRRAWMTRVLDAVPVATALAVPTALLLRIAGVPGPLGPFGVFVTALLPALLRPPTLRQIAAALDARHATGDLLLSARLTPPTDAWSVALRRSADALAATLPPAGLPPRVSPRQHACVLAAAVAVLAVGLQWTTPPAVPDAGSDPAFRDHASPPLASVAAETTARPDTGQSDTGQGDARLPAAAMPDVNPAGARRPAREGSAASGTGRAAAKNPPASPPAPTEAASAIAAASPTGRAGGSGTEAHGVDVGTAAGRVTPGSGRAAATPLTGGHGPAAPPPLATTPAAADGRYRELVRDFFER